MNWESIEEAQRRIEKSIVRTLLFEVPSRFCPMGARVLLKLENTQISGSFKARGAFNFIDRLCSAPTLPPGVVTFSSGNHGRAVAEAAAARGLPALVTVPDDVDSAKAAAIAAAGAEVVRAGPTSESRCERALAIAEERGWTVIPPFDHDWIIEGQATAAAEILEDCPDLTDLWVPVGGGGLSAGSAATLLARGPEVRLHAVEPAGAAGYAESVARGERVRLEGTASVADGLLPLAIGERNWAWLRRIEAHPVTVTEAMILASFRRMRLDLGIEAEPSGAVAAAPLLFPPRSERSEAGLLPGVHVAIVSGGNVDSLRVQRLLEG